MTGRRGGVTYRVVSAALGLVARLVPGARRAAWLEEWRAEVWHGLEGPGRGRTSRVLVRSVGAVRDAWSLRGGRPLRGLGADIRVAFRGLARSKRFAALTVGILAVGIGTNAAVLELARAALAGPLPYAHADRLVMVWERRPAQGRDHNPASLPDFVDWRARATSFDALTAMEGIGNSLTGVDQPRRLSGYAVSEDFFPAVGIAPLRGRVFAADEFDAGGARVTVIAHALWLDAFGGDPSAVGSTISLDLTPYRIVGVMPAGFGFPGAADFWVPLTEDPAAASRGSHRYLVLGRLAPGVEIDAARAELDRVAHALEAEYPDTNHGHYTAVYALRDEMLGDTRSVLFLLAGAVGVVLLIVCVNVANMELVRSTARARELAVRASLGATRTRLVRQLLVESCVLAGLGAAAALPVAWLSARLLQAWSWSRVSWAHAAPFDPAALAIAGGLALLAAVLSGLAPALRASRIGLAPTLHEDSARAGSGRTGRRWQRGLVTAQVALAVALLAGAGLLTRGLIELLGVDIGFDPHGVVTADVALPEARYEGGRAQLDFFEALIARVDGLPGVEAVGTAWMLPMSDREAGRDFLIEGREPPPDPDAWNARLRVVGGAYTEALRVPVRRGRVFEPSDATGAPPVALVNETAARDYWPDQDALGKRFTFDEAEPWITIVGVVGDVRHQGPATPADPEIYLPLAQSPQSFETVVARVAQGVDASTVIEAVRAEVRALDPDLPLANVGPYDTRVRAAGASSRELVGVVSLFALLALLLAATGIYAVVSFAILQRGREYGIRLALGGTAGRVQRGVVASEVPLVVVGAVAGLALFAAGSRLVAGFLFGVRPWDPVALGTSTAVLLVVAVAAVYLPARRITALDPARTLRE